MGPEEKVLGEVRRVHLLRWLLRRRNGRNTTRDPEFTSTGFSLRQEQPQAQGREESQAVGR